MLQSVWVVRKKIGKILAKNDEVFTVPVGVNLLMNLLEHVELCFFGAGTQLFLKLWMVENGR